MKVLWKIVMRTKRLIEKNVALIRGLVYKNKLQYYCPCCNRNIKEFTNGCIKWFPDEVNLNRYSLEDDKVICPICGSFPRHRILVEWLKENVAIIQKNPRILHFAQEKSLRAWFDRNNMNYTTADLKKPADLKIDIENTGLRAGEFDIIICNHVLEHVNDYKKALNELHRIIKQNGKVIISVPIDLKFDTVFENALVTTKEERIRLFGQRDHKRIFGRDTDTIFKEAGFDVIKIRGEQYNDSIKPVIGPADYDYNVLWCLTKKNNKQSDMVGI